MTYAQNIDSIDFDDFEAFTSHQGWTIVHDIVRDFREETNSDSLILGHGVAVNVPSYQGGSVLRTKHDYADFNLSLEFYFTKGATMEVLIQGRYVLTLSDRKHKSKGGNIPSGTILLPTKNEQRIVKGENREYPFSDASRQNGLWQILNVVFKAPKFNSEGVKIQNALFENVELNHVLIQSQVEVTGITDFSYFQDESNWGPLLFIGDDHITGVRNIRLLRDSINQAPAIPEQPIIVKATNLPRLVRSFMMYENEKLTNVLSVGHP